MSYFIEHLFVTLYLGIPLSLFLLAALAGGVLIDADHQGGAKVLLRCAVRNSSEACMREDIRRGITHTLQTYYWATVAFISITICWLTYTLHLVMDQILWW